MVGNLTKAKLTIAFCILLFAVFAVLSVYFWWAETQAPYFREAGIAIVGGFGGSAIYASWEKLTETR
jgi:hypothetical protein